MTALVFITFLNNLDTKFIEIDFATWEKKKNQTLKE